MFSLATLFESLATEEVIGTMIEGAVENRTPGAHTVKVSDIYQMWAVRIYLHGEGKDGLHKNFPLPEAVFGDSPMGRDRFIKLQHYWINPDSVIPLNNVFSKAMIVSEVLRIFVTIKSVLF